jgi:hypothetical protein
MRVSTVRPPAAQRPAAEARARVVAQRPAARAREALAPAALRHRPLQLRVERSIVDHGGRNPMFTSVTRNTSRYFAGVASLAGAITATGTAIYQLQVTPNPSLPAGAVVTAHIYVPAGSTVDWLQLFLQETASPYTWTGSAVSFTAGSWNTLTVKVPTSGGAIGLLGVQVHVTGAWTGTVYVDSVNW